MSARDPLAGWRTITHRDLLAADPHDVGPYKLSAVLGEGGFGSVYLGLDGRGVPVAVKTLRPGLPPSLVARFGREVAALTGIRSRFVVPAIDHGVHESRPYVVMPAVRGVSVQYGLRHDVSFTKGELIDLVTGLAVAVRDLHGAGVIHRDIKPANVLLTSHGPCLVDLGLAADLSADPERHSTVIGTPGFMAPERADGGSGTAASDVWAWARTLAVVRDTIAPAHEATFATLRPLLAACLSVDPQHRPADGRELVDQLTTLWRTTLTNPDELERALAALRKVSGPASIPWFSEEAQRAVAESAAPQAHNPSPTKVDPAPGVTRASPPPRLTLAERLRVNWPVFFFAGPLILGGLLLLLSLSTATDFIGVGLAFFGLGMFTSPLVVPVAEKLSAKSYLRLVRRKGYLRR